MAKFDSLFTILIIFLTITTLQKPVSCRKSEEFKTCSKTFSCGNITGLTYPFFSQSRPEYCGHPGFQLLNCDQFTQKIQIMMKSQRFYIFNISVTNSTMTVARQDFLDGFGCPLRFVNITLDYSIFNYTAMDSNMTLIYNKCSSKCTPFKCPNIVAGKTVPICFLTDKMMVKMNISEVVCTDKLFFPVLKSEVLGMDKADTYLPSAAWNGFELKWTANDGLCRDCRSSGGVCGHEPKSNKFFCFCSDESKCLFPGAIMHKGEIHLTKLNIVLLACFLTTGISMIIILAIVLKKRYLSEDRVSRREKRGNIEAFLKGQGSSGPRRYSYNEIKKMTNSFKDKLGEGGYGSVYKGILQDNTTLVAVKMLHKAKEEADEFINEVASIGNTNHVNVVKLYGFCYEGQRRALVYEFMENGSLEKFLYANNNHHSLGWETLFNIAIGVARGLEYLHRGCNIRILHFDIKPHNILLDENFCPKISDFGLAKSCPQKDSIISMSEARGTIGYIAPEVFLKSFGGVSYKSDVYSYGMLVLEMVGCRRKVEVEVEGQVSSEQSFPDWIYEQLEVGEGNEEGMSLIEEEMEMQRKMIVVSLWCVKTNPSSRPMMSKVVEMLEGGIETLQIPRASSLSVSIRSQQL